MRSPLVEIPQWESKREETVLRLLIVLAGIAQAVVLIIYSLNRYVHFDTGVDYAILAQATHLISRGDLNPFNTIYQDRFWQDQFDLDAWGLGLLRLGFPSSLTLLIGQALAIAATSVLVMRFALQRSLQLAWQARWAVVGGISLLVMLNPWTYEADSFDVHIQAFAGLFIVAAIVGFEANRRVLAYLMVALTLLAGSSLIVLMVGVGVGMLLVPRLRRDGVVVAVAGLVWLAVDLALGAHQGTSLQASYGYLAPGQKASLLSIAGGIFSDPLRPAAMLASRYYPIGQLIGYAGIGGILYPPAAIATLISVAVNGLQSSASFISLQAGFQNYPEEMLLLLGLSVVLVALAGKVANTSKQCWVLSVLVAAAAVGIAAQETVVDVAIPPAWLTELPAAASALSTVRLGPNTEVISTIGVIGRFASHRYVFGWFSNPESFPVCTQRVVVIFSTAGYEILPAAQVAAAESNLSHLPHVSRLAAGPGVAAFVLKAVPHRQVIQLGSGRLLNEASTSAVCS